MFFFQEILILPVEILKAGYIVCCNNLVYDNSLILEMDEVSFKKNGVISSE